MYYHGVLALTFITTYTLFFSYLQLKQEFKLKINLDNPVHSLMDNWDLWKSRVFKYAKLECNSRKGVKDLIEAYELSIEVEDSGIKTANVSLYKEV